MAQAILGKCQEIHNEGMLAKDLLGLCGYDMLDEVSSIIAYRDALVAEFEVKVY